MREHRLPGVRRLHDMARPMQMSPSLASITVFCGRQRAPPGGTVMSRSCSVLLLLLGLASAGAAQAPNPVPWTLALGAFTIFGHTTYNPTVVLVPRVVYDTAHGLDSARVVDSVRAAAKKSVGFAAGLS